MYKKKLNLNRLNKVVIAAAKQSGRSYFPDLSEPLSFLEWTRRRFEGTTLVCHYSSDSYIHDLEFQDLRSVNVIIGPEGDFSPKELTVFQELKIPNVKLSLRRLRSESACSAALNQINQAYQIQNG